MNGIHGQTYKPFAVVLVNFGDFRSRVVNPFILNLDYGVSDANEIII